MMSPNKQRNGGLGAVGPEVKLLSSPPGKRSGLSSNSRSYSTSSDRRPRHEISINLMSIMSVLAAFR